MLSGDRLQALVEKHDSALAGIEDRALQRVNAALERSYRQLERDLLRAYEKHAGNLSLLPNQRKLLILSEVQGLLTLINPQQAEQLQKDFETMLKASGDAGQALVGQLSQAIANEQLQSFASVPLEAVRYQAEDGMRRLSRHTADFASRTSAVVEQALVQGWGARKTASALRGELGITKGKAEQLARTETLSSNNQAIAANAKRNGFEAFQFFATSDDRLCPTCGSRNQQIYKLGESQPPAHPSCRCIAVPIKLDWIEAGLIDTAWSQQFREGAIAEVEASGQRLNTGLAPFEKSNGLPRPEPLWTPGQTLQRPTPAPVRSDRLPADHVITLNPRYTAAAIDEALDSIESTGASDRIQMLREFIAQNQLQAVFWDSSRDKAQNVALARQIRYRPQRVEDVEITDPEDYKGFSITGWKHVVVKSDGTKTGRIYDWNQTDDALKRIYGVAASNDGWELYWSMSETHGQRSAEMITYLHELGHVVHDFADNPPPPETGRGSATEYGKTDPDEFFAEHFTAWMLDAERLRKYDPVTHDFIESSFKRALGQ